MKLIGWIALIVCGLFIQKSSAAGTHFGGGYYYIPVTAAELDPRARTHIVIAGRGSDLSTALQYAATAKIRKIREIYPNDQILFIAVHENKDNANLLRLFGYKHAVFRNSYLSSNSLMGEVSTFESIASLHVFSHSGVVAGIFLDKSSPDDAIRWLPHDPEAIRLKGHFTEDAYATLNGCNAGHVQAPILSQLWEIPVAGALASSHFEGLYHDGNYYWAETKNRNLMQKCVNGTCYRLRPDNATYRGHWGVFKQGLPFFKFFCASDNEKQCLSAMAASIVSNVSHLNLGRKMSYEQYAAAVREWLCPAGLHPSPLQKNCMNTLARMDLKNPNRTYTPFPVGSSQCNFKTCYEPPECMYPDQRLCPKEPPLVRPSTTFVDEYIHYLRAYKYFKKLNSAG